MIRFIFLIRRIVAGLFFALFATQIVEAQCVITSKPDGCVGVSENFTVSGAPVSAPYDSIVWVFNNGLDGKSTGVSVTNVWNKPTGGSSPAIPITIEVKVYKGGLVTCSAETKITIHANPIADFRLLSSAVQCYKGNSFSFENLTTTPSGNPIVFLENVFGDKYPLRDSIPNPIPKTLGPHHMTVAKTGGKYDNDLKVIDSKGCVSSISKQNIIEIKPDIGANFSTNDPKDCISTEATFTNTSLITLSDVKNFTWDFGDGTAKNTSDWTGFKHTYTKNGCFNATLIVQSNDGCYDTVVQKAACNTNPELRVSVKNGDVQCLNNQNFIFEHLPVKGATFLWRFDDPPSGNLNENDDDWEAGHTFTGIGPYNVTFRLETNGCTFDTLYPVHVKGPAALLETRANNPGVTFVTPSQRYQCKIKDTVFFVNQSQYYLNDEEPFNDFYYISANQQVFQFTDKTHLNVEYDTIDLKTGVAKNIVTRTGKNVFISASGDTIAINRDTLVFDGNIVKQGQFIVVKDNFNTKNSHTLRLWDFADNQAPQCTTDSRPIYPKDARYGNLHWPTSPAPAWTYDANGKWYNCNFNRDSLPKHWYSPGFEQCYTVIFTLKDTSKKDPNIRALTSSHNDPAMPDSACESIATIPLALTQPSAKGLRWTGIPCYGPSNVYGFEFDFSNTGPSCDRQQFWVHFDSTADRVDNTPNIFNKWIPQNGTIINRSGTPWNAATNNGTPPNVGGIFWQYQPNGAYPNKIASPDGWVTIGLRIQNGIDPTTGQPCIDEQWYHNAYRYIQANPSFKFFNQDNPDSTYTFSRTCSPQEIFVKRDSTYQPTTKTSTYSSDSIGAEIWNWGDGVMEIDSFFRYINKGDKLYSYRIRYQLVGNNAPVITDSVVTRIYDPVLGRTTFVDARDSTPDIVRSHRYTNSERNQISHTIIPCQMMPIDSLGHTVYRKSCCDNPPFQVANIAVTGFLSDLLVSDTIVCRNQPIVFDDTSRYYLEVPTLAYPYILDRHDYWANPTVDANGAFRDKPNPGQYETIRWNFGDGSGWNSSVPQNPVRSYSDPGVYDVQVEYTDSIGCKQIARKRITVTGVAANFTFDRKIDKCRPTVDFVDSTIMLDPCLLINNTNCDGIVSWEWDFGDNKGNASTSILKKPSKVYTSFGDFEVKLIITTQLGCKDSITRTISLEGPRPRFEFAADSVGCVPFTVELRNTSINATNDAEWTWFFGDGDFVTTRADSNVRHTYDSAGVFEIFLLQNDSTKLGGGKCDGLYPDTAQTGGNYRKYIVRVLPSRKTSFTIGDTVLCVGDSTLFTSTSDTIYSRFTWIWENNADTTKGTKAEGADKQWHTFNKPGTWYVQLRPTYFPDFGDPACPTSAVKKVQVGEVKADFVCDTSDNPFRYFKNLSVNAQQVFWDFGAGDGYVDGATLPDFPHGSHNYGEKQGKYTVRLKVISPEGCEAEAFCDLNYFYPTLIDPPNVFTPGNGDTLNNVFEVDVLNEEEYRLTIFNRWGEKVYETESKDTKWDGKHMGTGVDCPAGVYFVVINYRLRGEADKVYKGTLSLLRDK